jgi:hypothetical protein
MMSGKCDPAHQLASSVCGRRPLPASSPLTPRILVSSSVLESWFVSVRVRTSRVQRVSDRARAIARQRQEESERARERASERVRESAREREGARGARP